MCKNNVYIGSKYNADRTQANKPGTFLAITVFQSPYL